MTYFISSVPCKHIDVDLMVTIVDHGMIGSNYHEMVGSNCEIFHLVL